MRPEGKRNNAGIVMPDIKKKGGFLATMEFKQEYSGHVEGLLAQQNKDPMKKRWLIASCDGEEGGGGGRIFHLPSKMGLIPFLNTVRSHQQPPLRALPPPLLFAVRGYHTCTNLQQQKMDTCDKEKGEGDGVRLQVRKEEVRPMKQLVSPVDAGAEGRGASTAST